MDYYCETCDKSNKLKSKNKHLQSLTNNKPEECIRIKHTIQNSDFFDLDLIFNSYITNHNKTFDSYIVKYDFKLVFEKYFHPYVKSEFHYVGETNSEHNILLKMCFLALIEFFLKEDVNDHKFVKSILKLIVKKDLWPKIIILSNRYQWQIWKWIWQFWKIQIW